MLLRGGHRNPEQIAPDGYVRRDGGFSHGGAATAGSSNLRHALKVEFREEFFACAAREAPLLARARAVQPQVELSFEPDRLGLSLPAIIVPDPYPRQQPIKFGKGHPLDGVIVHQVSDVLTRLRSLNREDLRDAEALLRLCADDRFVVSAIAPTAVSPATHPFETSLLAR